MTSRACLMVHGPPDTGPYLPADETAPPPGVADVHRSKTDIRGAYRGAQAVAGDWFHPLRSICCAASDEMAQTLRTAQGLDAGRPSAGSRVRRLGRARSRALASRSPAASSSSRHTC